MSKERLTTEDRKKIHAVAFAIWLHDYFMPLDSRGWVLRHPEKRKTTIMFTGDLYDEFIKKTKK